ncbi:MAG: molybdopterin-dependent oxidoreductase [Propionibacteriaceae bacterium]
MALLWLLIGAFASGWVSFAAARPLSATLATAAHGGLALGVIALGPWKAVIIRRARLRPAGLVLLSLLLVSLAAGFVQLFLGYVVVGGLSPIQVHVGAALIGVPLLGWHVRSRHRQRVRSTDVSRRALLRWTAGLAGVGAAYAGVLGLAQLTGGLTRRPAATGSRAVDPDQIPATIWLLDRVPTLTAEHRVDVAGRSVTAADLAFGAEDVTARLDCTSGWYAEARWRGRRLSDLLRPDPLRRAVGVRVISVTGYHRTFPVSAAPDLWLATSCQGRPLTELTGAPVRLVAPGYRGFWWVKWVTRVELTQDPAWRQLPFPPQ